MDFYETRVFDAKDFKHFYIQVANQIWYVLNYKKIKETPEEDKDEFWEEDNKRIAYVEDRFKISYEDGFDDIDIGYLFVVYAVLQYYAEEISSWSEIDTEINDLVAKYRLLNHTN